MPVLTSRSALVTQLVEALGLRSDHVSSIDISIRPADVVRVTVGMYTDEKAEAVVKRFVLSAEEAPPPGGPAK